MNSILRSARLFRALSHPVRLELVSLLNDEEQCVCHLTASTGKRQAYISQQLAALRSVGLVQIRKEGLRVYYRLNSPGTLALLRALDMPPSSHRHERGCECPKCVRVKGAK